MKYKTRAAAGDLRIGPLRRQQPGLGWCGCRLRAAPRVGGAATHGTKVSQCVLIGSTHDLDKNRNKKKSRITCILYSSGSPRWVPTVVRFVCYREIFTHYYIVARGGTLRTTTMSKHTQSR